jgi:hypothetical protein
MLRAFDQRRNTMWFPGMEDVKGRLHEMAETERIRRITAASRDTLLTMLDPLF